MPDLNLRVPIDARNRMLQYYHANKELMNVQSYLCKLNKDGRHPQYAHIVAYELRKDPTTAKWCMSDYVKQLMKQRAHWRLHPEENPAYAALHLGVPLPAPEQGA